MVDAPWLMRTEEPILSLLGQRTCSEANSKLAELVKAQKVTNNDTQA